MTVPPISERQRANYIRGYPLLQADLEPNYARCSTVIPITFDGLLTHISRSGQWPSDESEEASRVLAQLAKPKSQVVTKNGCLELFQPMTRAEYGLPSTGRLTPSFENGLSQITEDLGPYVRAIITYDMRLEKYRSKLGSLLSRDTKRTRRTRASRAALEGGDKAFTRKEKWFDVGSHGSQILDTGKREWQDVLIQQGYFAVGTMDEHRRDEAAYESTSEGDF